MKTPLFTRAWWKDVAERAWSNGLQVIIPVLALGVSGDLSSIDPLAVVLTLALSTVTVVLKAVAGLSGGNWLERAVGAAAGAAIALLPLKALDLLAFDWRTFAVAVVSSAALAVAKAMAVPADGSATAPPEKRGPDLPL